MWNKHYEYIDHCLKQKRYVLLNVKGKEKIGIAVVDETLSCLSD